MYQGYKVIDFHVHFPYGAPLFQGWYDRYQQKYGKEKLDLIRSFEAKTKAQWRKDNVFDDPVDIKEPDLIAEKWKAEVDKYGIDKVAFVTGGGNDILAAMVQKDPRFIGFAHHSPFQAGAAEELKRAVNELGLRGYKVLAPLIPEDIDDERAYPTWEMAEKLHIPVLIHIGIIGGNGGLARVHNSNPLLLHDIAKAFPRIPFIVPHFGAGFPNEFFQLARACHNIYTDTAGSFGWTRWMPYELSLKDLLRKAMETIGLERVIFGSDSSWFPRGFSIQYLKDLIRDCRQIGIKDEDIRLILAGNAERILSYFEK